ncbi:MAG: 5'-nucleotidase C-terminal domain-containing protein [Chloroflexota bacterium]
MAPDATAQNPTTLKVSDMFAGMPYENSLVTLRMNGPQLKRVLERAYRNYYYYKNVAGYGGYSYYTTCMIDTNSIGKITYNDLPGEYNPAVNHVLSLSISGKLVDFANATKTYLVSTVNYLAAGSCNFNDGGVSLWPLDQIVNDSQLYVRDAVIDYITAMGSVSPAIEGRLQFIADTTGPVVKITSPTARAYGDASKVPATFSATDTPAGVATVTAKLDGVAIKYGAKIDLLGYKLGSKHTLAVRAEDRAGNVSTKSVTFTVTANLASLRALVNREYGTHDIRLTSVRNLLLAKLATASTAMAHGNVAGAKRALSSFILHVQVRSGWLITTPAAHLLVRDAKYVSAHLR